MSNITRGRHARPEKCKRELALIDAATAWQGLKGIDRITAQRINKLSNASILPASQTQTH